MPNITNLEVAQQEYKFREYSSRTHILHTTLADILPRQLQNYKRKTEKKYILPSINLTQYLHPQANSLLEASAN